jgi:hypothetical protein
MRRRWIYVVGFWPDTHQRFAAGGRYETAKEAEDDIVARHPGVAICGVVVGDSAAQVMSVDGEADMVRYSSEEAS